MEVAITTPTGTRRVCQHDTITIAFEFTPAPGSEGISPDAYATWDQIWRKSAKSPETLGTNSSDNNFGHIYWGDDVTSLSYSVDLNLFICHAIADPAAGVISVGSTTWPGLIADIEVEICPDINCCIIQPICEPCCFYLVSLGFVWNSVELQWEQYSENAAFGLLATIKMGGNPLVCMEGEVQITLWIVTKDRNLHDDAIFDVEFDTDWPLTAAAGNDPERPVGYVGVVKWSDVQDINYTLRVGPSCILGFTGPGTVSWLVTETLSNTSLGGVAEFIPCDTPEDCNCCCPKFCCWDCYFPVRPDFCDETNGAELYDPDSFTKITGLEILTEYSPPVPCEDEETTFDEVRQIQTGPSLHRITCGPKCADDLSAGLCGRSVCQFILPARTLANGCPESEDVDYTIEITYVAPGLWAIGTPGGVGSIPAYVGCDGGSFEVTFTSGPYTITRTITFTVERNLEGGSPTCPEEDEDGEGYGEY
jgi:hypothetical protein